MTELKRAEICGTDMTINFDVRGGGLLDVEVKYRLVANDNKTLAPTAEDMVAALRSLLLKCLPDELVESGQILEQHGDHPLPVLFEKELSDGRRAFLYRCGELGCGIGTNSHPDTLKAEAVERWNRQVYSERGFLKSKREQEIKDARATLARLAPEQLIACPLCRRSIHDGGHCFCNTDTA